MWAGFKRNFNDPEGYATQTMNFLESHFQGVKSNYLNFGNATGIENSTDVSDE